MRVLFSGKSASPYILQTETGSALNHRDSLEGRLLKPHQASGFRTLEIFNKNNYNDGDTFRVLKDVGPLAKNLGEQEFGARLLNVENTRTNKQFEDINARWFDLVEKV